MTSNPELRDTLKNVLASIQAAKSTFPTVLATNNRPLQPRLQPQSPVSIPARFNAAFAAVNAIEQIILLQSTQDAFFAAQKLPPAPANLSKKRKRLEVPVASDLNTKRPSIHRIEIPSTAAFPQNVPSEPRPINHKSLEEYIRHVNKQGLIRLQLWSRSRTAGADSETVKLVKPTYLRLTIPDLLVAYLDIQEQTGINPGYQVLLVTVFGVREKSHPEADIPTIIVSRRGLRPFVSINNAQDLLSSYKELYSETCVVCDQCWSVEGDLPPVHRLWKPFSSSAPGEGTSAGQWLPRHYLCTRAST
ncbi:11357_t:CDS:2 [Acaulospora colombiana]|uniref:11357_t:CDS:1 n=1 Tax=Acaulospora colombiana TaxID=27376 RepID=A0ACA9M9J2_9GLOM|nr:11357_t:CDS:2 [Acaulospora colombiana]